MSRRVTIIGAGLFALVVAAVAVPFVAKARLKANIAGSQNNLRELALFAAHHANPDPRLDRRKLAAEVPAGTVALRGVEPDGRLSWVVPLLPGFDQRKVNSEQLLGAIDLRGPWAAEPNQAAGRTRIAVLLCPESPPEVPPGAPGVTCYVGVGGRGRGAPGLPADAPNAGAMRFDAPTPFARITAGDGISQTFLFAETRNEIGPWLRGGAATLRGLDDGADARPLIGGQFGGYFPALGHFAFCDGGVRGFTPQAAPAVLLGHATMNGRGVDPLPGE